LTARKRCDCCPALAAGGGRCLKCSIASLVKDVFILSFCLAGTAMLWDFGMFGRVSPVTSYFTAAYARLWSLEWCSRLRRNFLLSVWSSIRAKLLIPITRYLGIDLDDAGGGEMTNRQPEQASQTAGRLVIARVNSARSIGVAPSAWGRGLYFFLFFCCGGMRDNW